VTSAQLIRDSLRVITVKVTSDTGAVVELAGPDRGATVWINEAHVDRAIAACKAGESVVVEYGPKWARIVWDEESA
jgi:hypothetical protein